MTRKDEGPDSGQECGAFLFQPSGCGRRMYINEV